MLNILDLINKYKILYPLNRIGQNIFVQVRGIFYRAEFQIFFIYKNYVCIRYMLLYILNSLFKDITFTGTSLACQHLYQLFT